MTAPIECPSGLVFTPRKMAGRLFAQLAAKSDVSGLGAVVQQLCVKIEGPGPYALAKDGTINWARVIAGDISVALAKIRTISMPPNYDGQVFSWMIKCADRDCRDDDGKRTEYVWTTRIDDVPIVKLSSEGRERVKNGNVFPGTLLDGRPFTFKLPTDEDGPVIRRLLTDSGINLRELNEDNVAAVLLPFLAAARILSVGGCRDARSARNELLDGDPATLNDVAEQINKIDCGFDAFQAKCPCCGLEKDLALPTTPQLLLSLSHAVRKTEKTETPPTTTLPPSSSVELGASSKPTSRG